MIPTRELNSFDQLKIKIFADGANEAELRELNALDHIKGVTTNPTLMRQAGVRDYEAFARSVLEFVRTKPVSFEVIADTFTEMESQARRIADWGDNVYVKIPITNTKGESSIPSIQKLTGMGVKLNITAIMTLQQVEKVALVLKGGAAGIVSVFAGRIADTGRDPVPLMKQAKAILEPHSNTELLWASPRELLNIIQADEAGCDIITATPSILSKLSKIGYSLDEFSLDTVKMFYNDARSAALTL